MSTYNPYAPKKRQAKVEEAPKVEAPVYEVPEGSITVVLKWVNGDSERAKAAYAAEVKDPKPRVSLLGQLEDLF